MFGREGLSLPTDGEKRGRGYICNHNAIGHQFYHYPTWVLLLHEHWLLIATGTAASPSNYGISAASPSVIESKNVCKMIIL